MLRRPLLCALLLLVQACARRTPLRDDGAGRQPAVAAPGDAADAGRAAAVAHPVVILSIDGLRADMVEPGSMPVLCRLRTEGAWASDARTILPSLTLPSHASMLTGMVPGAHGVDWNVNAPGRQIRVPTVLDAARRAGLRTAVVVGKDKFVTIVPQGSVASYVLVAGDDAGVTQAAERAARQGFDLMFVHFPEVDLNGHGYGWLSPEYLAAVRRADTLVGRLRASLPREAILIVTADHGGDAQGHGGDSPAHMRIPWIAHGPTVVPGRVIRQSVTTLDTAVTAARLLGIALGDPRVTGHALALGRE